MFHGSSTPPLHAASTTGYIHEHLHSHVCSYVRGRLTTETADDSRTDVTDTATDTMANIARPTPPLLIWETNKWKPQQMKLLFYIVNKLLTKHKIYKDRLQSACEC